jgi:hypothetical protein
MSGLFGVLGRSMRGFRLVEAVALLVLLAMILGNYLSKARAGRERAEIAAVEAQIGEEQHRMRLLDAEVAHLEQPERLERLSAAAGLGPTGARHQGAIDQLPEISRAALVTEKVQQRHGAGVSTQTGFDDAAPAPAKAGQPTRWGGPQ